MSQENENQPNNPVYYFSRYNEKLLSPVFEKYGAFFAFGQEQLDDGLAKYEQHYEGTKPVKISGFSGLVVPESKAAEFNSKFHETTEQAKKDFLAQDGFLLTEFVEYTLRNHECYWIGSIGAAVEELAYFDITREQANKVYRGGNLDFEPDYDVFSKTSYDDFCKERGIVREYIAEVTDRKMLSDLDALNNKLKSEFLSQRYYDEEQVIVYYFRKHKCFLDRDPKSAIGYLAQLGISEAKALECWPSSLIDYKHKFEE